MLQIHHMSVSMPIHHVADVKHFEAAPVYRPAEIKKTASYSNAPKKVRYSSNKQEIRIVRSVLVANAFSYPVVQQPEGEPFYVSDSRDLLTEFSLAKPYGNLGLMAHNNLAGQSFGNLELGQIIYINYSDGQSDRYTITHIYRFHALEPTKTDSLFIDLDSQKLLTATELFEKMYTGPQHLTFQTCIAARGDPSWGRLFVIASPIANAEEGDPAFPTNQEKAAFRIRWVTDQR